MAVRLSALCSPTLLPINIIFLLLVPISVTGRVNWKNKKIKGKLKKIIHLIATLLLFSEKKESQKMKNILAGSYVSALKNLEHPVFLSTETLFVGLKKCCFTASYNHKGPDIFERFKDKSKATAKSPQRWSKMTDDLFKIISMPHCLAWKWKKTKLRDLSPRANYTESDSHLSVKLMPTFADRGVPRCLYDESLQPQSRFSRPEPLLFLSSSSSIVLTWLSGPRSRTTTAQKIW
jgi:hypothetical protein